MTLRNNQPGFALPMAILVIGFMTAGVLAAFARTTAEVQIVDDQTVETRAFANAERGLGQFLATGSVPANPTTATYAFGGPDSAVITAIQMRAAASPTDTAIWLVRSTGRVGATGSDPAGTRTVAQLAYMSSVTMEVYSSWTSLSGLDKNGNSGVLSGVDACSCTPCTGDTKAGVATPNNGYDGKDKPIQGDPPHLEMGTQEQMANQIHIDWEGITNAAAPAISPSVFTPSVGADPVRAVACTSGSYPNYDSDWNGQCGSFPSQNWFDNNPNQWPTVFVNGNSSLPANGRGTLIVLGDLTIGGGQTWDGIILVGGRIVDNGNGAISGAVVTGLNILKDCPNGSGSRCTVAESSRANGTKAYRYDSCKISRATSSLARLKGVSNAWVDNWATW